MLEMVNNTFYPVTSESAIENAQEILKPFVRRMGGPARFVDHAYLA